MQFRENWTGQKVGKLVGFEAKTSVRRRMSGSTVAETMRSMRARVADIAVVVGLDSRKTRGFLASHIPNPVEIREPLHSISYP